MRKRRVMSESLRERHNLDRYKILSMEESRSSQAKKPVSESDSTMKTKAAKDSWSRSHVPESMLKRSHRKAHAPVTGVIRVSKSYRREKLPPRKAAGAWAGDTI